jgi:hypothetical protein
MSKRGKKSKQSKKWEIPAEKLRYLKYKEPEMLKYINIFYSNISI